MKELKGKVAAVTGAASGLGRAMALAFASEGMHVALADLECREKTGFRAAYAEIQFALEEEFIADHKAELDALKAAAEQGR